jgi:hypothetical protein
MIESFGQFVVDRNLGEPVDSNVQHKPGRKNGRI